MMPAPQTPERRRPTAKDTHSYTSSPNTPFSTPGTLGSRSGHQSAPEVCSEQFRDEQHFNNSPKPRKGENKSNTDLPVTNLPSGFESPPSNPSPRSPNTTVHRNIPEAASPKPQVVEQIDTFNAETGQSHQKSHQSGKGRILQSTTAADIRSLRKSFHIKSADDVINFVDLTESDNEEAPSKAHTASDHRNNDTTDLRETIDQTEPLLGQESKRTSSDPTCQSTGSSSDTNAIQSHDLGSDEVSGTSETKSATRSNKGANSSTRLSRAQKGKTSRRKRMSDQMPRPRTLLQSSESVPEGIHSVTRDKRHQILSRRKIRAASEPILPKHRDNPDAEVNDALDANSQQGTMVPQPITPLHTMQNKIFNKNKPKSATDIMNKLRESLENKNKTKKDPSKQGYIYIYTSPSYPNLVKIGSTKNLPELRVKKWAGDCKVECIRIGDYYDSIFPSFVLIESLIKDELSNEQRTFTCDSCKKANKDENKAHEEWYEIPVEHALKVVQRWRRWILECSPYKSDGTLTKKWDWKLKVDKVKNGDWDVWTQPFTPYDILRYLLYHAWKAFIDYVPTLRSILMHRGLLIWLAIPFIYLYWGGTVILLSLFLGIVVFLWVYLWYE